MSLDDGTFPPRWSEWSRRERARYLMTFQGRRWMYVELMKAVGLEPADGVNTLRASEMAVVLATLEEYGEADYLDQLGEAPGGRKMEEFRSG